MASITLEAIKQEATKLKQKSDMWENSDLVLPHILVDMASCCKGNRKNTISRWVS